MSDETISDEMISEEPVTAVEPLDTTPESELPVVPSGPEPVRGVLPTVGAALLVLLVTFILYALSAAPTVGYGEAARLQTAAHDFELSSDARARPLFVGLAHVIATHLSLGDFAYQVNLVSALTAALAVLVVFMLSLALLDAAGLGTPRGRLLFAAAGAASLAVAHAFWARAVIADPTPLNLLLVGVVTALWVVCLGGAGGWTIITGTVLLGLLIINQRSIILVTPIYLAAGIGLLASRSQRSTSDAMRVVLFAYSLALLPCVALLITDGVHAFLPGRVASGHGFAALAGLVRDAIGGPIQLHPARAALTGFGLRLAASFLAATLLAAIGMVVLLIRPGARGAGLFLLGLAAAAAAGSLLTTSTDIVAWTVLAACVAVGAASLGRASGRAAVIFAVLLVGVPLAFQALLPRLAARPDWRPWITAAISVPSPGPGTSLRPWRIGDHEALKNADDLLAAVPDRALLIAGGEIAEPLRYLQRVEKRPMRGIVIASPGSGARADIDTLLDRNLGARPVVIAAADTASLAVARRRALLLPRGPIWIAEQRPASLELADRAFAERRFWEACVHYGNVLAVGGGIADPVRDRAQIESLARWAVSLEVSGFPELGSAVTSRVLAAAPDAWQGNLLLGELYSQAGLEERAASHFAAALGVAPEAALAERAYLEGRLAESRGDKAAAVAAYRRALDLDPGQQGARERLGGFGER